MNSFFFNTPDICDTECICLPDNTILCDRFRIKRTLYRNQDTVFYHAKDTLLQEDIGMKTIDIGPCGNKALESQLKYEMGIHQKLKDPNIVNVYDLHPATIGGAKLLIMTMEYAEKGSFSHWLKKTDNYEILRTNGKDYIKQICRGIGVAHQQGIVHLSVNPDNIFLTDSRAKLSNFSLCNYVQSKLTDEGFDRSFFIEDSVNHPYMSPELFNTPHPDELTTASDIYSLGIILYQIYHPQCRTPFSGSYSNIRDLHLNVPAKRLETGNDSISDIISRCLQKDPGKRYQNSLDLLDELENKPNRKTQDQIENRWQKAINFYQQKNFSDALSVIKNILSLRPDHEQALHLQNKLLDRFKQAKQFYDEIKLNLEGENGNLKNSLELLKQAIKLYPDHPAGALLQHKILILSDNYKNHLERGVDAIQAHRWEDALYLFQQAEKIESNSEKLKRRIDILLAIKNMRQQIDELLFQKKFNQARRVAQLVDLKIAEIKGEFTRGTHNDLIYR